MSTIRLREATTSTPEQYVAGLIDFRGNPLLLPENATQMFEAVLLIDPGYHLLLSVDKNVRGWLLGIVLATVGRRVLQRAFENSLKVIETPNVSAPTIAQPPRDLAA